MTVARDMRCSAVVIFYFILVCTVEVSAVPSSTTVSIHLDSSAAEGRLRSLVHDINSQASVDLFHPMT